MCERILEGRKRKNKTEEDTAMGFANFGGYFESKKLKLLEQFEDTASNTKLKSNIFKDVAIFVNGLTNPNSSELKKIMAEHGGMFHGYRMSTTTHIIASNLAYAKTKNLGSVPIVKASWITDCIEMKKLLDYKRYLLFSDQKDDQGKLNFSVLPQKDDKKESLSSSPFKIMNEINNRKPTKTASDPQFLEEFYNNSRLHLIATMGAEFKQLVIQMREKSNVNYPGKDLLLKEKHTNDMRRVYNSVIMHIDMDCFFVSVGLRYRPELKGKPVVVTHAKNGHISSFRPGRSAEIALNLERAPENIVEKITNLDSHSSMSEIACCSYEARKFGIKNGMFLGAAVKLCPNLKTMQYDFEEYKEVASTLYKTVASYTLDIEAVSCDEMYVDITKILNETCLTVDQFATILRTEIADKTGCPCSTGFGENKLQARLATKKAKPNGQFYIDVNDVESFFSEIPLGDLPGVGKATLNKLKNLELNTCGDVQNTNLNLLRTELGQKIGENLFDQAKGIDKKPLNFCNERKSVSAEVNYGIRFKTSDESYKFLESLSQEVFNRLNDLGMKSKCLTLKLMVRSSDAPVETAKFLGHGLCDSLSRSTTSNILLGDPKTIFKAAKQLYDKLNVPFVDLRGIGIQLTKLEKNLPINSLMCNFLKQSDLNSNKPSSSVTKLPVEKISPHKSIKGNEPIGGIKFKKSSAIPKVEHLKNMENPTKTNDNHEVDINVLNELPEELRYEIINEYTPVKIVDKINEKNTNKVKLLNTNEINEDKKTPFDNLDVEEFKIVLRKWINSELEPKQVDIDIISAHFRKLAMSKKIVDLKILFNFLHRTFFTMSCKWHDVYSSIANSAQQGMVARYGGILSIENSFDCT